MITILDKVLEQGDLSPGVLASAFGNLAQATARQQRPNMAKLLSALSQSFQIQAMNDVAQETAEEQTEWLGALQAQTKAQLGREYADAVERAKLGREYADAVERAKALGERGALRALVWGRKVSVVQSSLLGRFLKQGEALLEGTRIHICEACGFVMVRADAPDACPICKAPSGRFTSL
jgi:rubrerythrin